MGVDPYRLLPDYIRKADTEGQEDALRRFLSAVTTQADRAWAAVDALDPAVAPSGRATAFDPSMSPVSLLPWLALLTGLMPDYRDVPVDRLRAVLEAPPGRRRRGSAEAIKMSVEATLTGTRTVEVDSHVGGNPWRVNVQVVAAETPDPAATEAAAVREKPAGVFLVLTTAAAAHQHTMGSLAGRASPHAHTLGALAGRRSGHSHTLGALRA